MTYVATVDLWCPNTGCELDADAAPAQIFDTVCGLLREKLRLSVPSATLVWAALRRDTRLEYGRPRAGYSLTVTMSVALDSDIVDGLYLRWLRGWLEAQVSVALLELINPMRVEDVTVLRPWDLI